uniref:Uncharacterized protein n=1 Tax=Salmonella sp. TaxID=599 RepID=A0A482EUE2_SALSP|nr:hypothetical protein NNIBIDOC_00115 [Salmonella sp.]
MGRNRLTPEQLVWMTRLTEAVLLLRRANYTLKPQSYTEYVVCLD